MTITDPADPRLDGYVGLKDGARIRARGRFVAESRPVVARLVSARPDLVESLLMTENQWDNLQRQLDPWSLDVPVLLAERPVLQAVAGFPIHRGCLALARCPALDTPTLWADGPGWWLAMEAIGDTDNMGSLLRTAQVLGARGVLHTPNCVDPLYRRSVRVSMGAAFLLPRATAPWTTIFERCKASGIRTAALTPTGDTRLAWGDDPFRSDRLGGERGGNDRWALWLGAEGPGLSEPLLAAADLRLAIPMTEGADSLNVAVAAALAAWAFRGRS